MDFVDFNLAKKLKEKGFNCELPYAMYNEIGQFCLLTTSAPYHVCESGYKYREYYDYNDFDKYDFIAPTIDQVLKWLRDKGIHIKIAVWVNCWYFQVCEFDAFSSTFRLQSTDYASYEEAAIGGIEYVLDNLI